MRRSRTQRGCRCILGHIAIALAVSCLSLKPGRSQVDCTTDRFGVSAYTLTGNRFDFSTLRGTPVLLAFLDIADNDVESASRSQAVILQSLDRQYGKRGVKVIAIDLPSSGNPSTLRHSDLVNGIAGWNIKFTVLEGSRNGCSLSSPVATLPTEIVMSADGFETGRWEGYTRTPVLAQAIERLVGGPLGGLPDAATEPERILHMPCRPSPG